MPGNQKEFRAVFGNAHNDNVSTGKTMSTLEEALLDRPVRSEETHEYLVGVMLREVTPWTPVPLATILESER